MKTLDYSIFKTIDGNRNINKGHVSRLVNAIERKNLLQYFPVLLNEKYEVIDGQHRLLAAMRLGLPVDFEVIQGLELQDVVSINTNSINWSLEDFINSYIELGREHYKTLKAFMDEYHMGATTSASLLAGVNGFKGGWNTSVAIKNGSFKIGSLEQAEKIAKQIREISKYCDNFVPSRDREFIAALLRLSKNKDFDFTRLISKLKLNGLMIEKRPSDKYYIIHIEELYNFNVKIESSKTELYVSTLKNTI